MSLNVNYGKDNVEFDLPTGWELIANGVLPQTEPAKDPIAEINRALDNPIGMEKLKDIIKPGMKISILFDDVTRPTRTDLVFPELLKRLNDAGVKDEDITAVCAMGTHRLNTPDEHRKKVGDVVYNRINVVNHDCFSTDNVIMGRTTYGTLVEIDPHVFRSDFSIGIGGCIPHVLAGFGGGPKLVLPGICSARTNNEWHMKWAMNPTTELGIIDGNFTYLEEIEVCRMIHFGMKIDIVMDMNGDIVNVFAGDVEEQHKSAMERAKDVYGVKIPRLADVTICSGYPHDIHLGQSFKGLSAGAVCTKPGGYLIWLSPNYEGHKDLDLVDAVGVPLTANEMHKKLVAGELPLPCPPYGVDFNIIPLLLRKISERCPNIIHITQGFTKEQVEKMGYRYADNIQQAIAEVHRELPKAGVNVIPAGSITLPLIG